VQEATQGSGVQGVYKNPGHHKFSVQNKPS